ncbi:sodium channel protein Nach-like [Zootermopsis nevadensis]|uniref:sodium channel protein Nach-like n=1 Tax=Zootermopsis nevadensis TaxID=136037 RepID=UPI000B8E62DF|nr:sodium channel protein Nach-like [Zootermopsis nevadensis]
MKAVYMYCLMFLENSSIHGLNHLIAKKRTPTERVLWLLFISAGIVGAVSFGVSTWRRYQSNPTVVSMEREYKDWNTSFPSVTICPQQKYNNISAKAKSQSDDVYKFIKNLVSASYENFDELEPGLSEGIFSPEQYMEVIINNSFELTHKSNFDVHFTKTITEMGLCYTYLSNIAIYNSPEYWQNKNWTIMKKDVQLYGNPLSGEISLQITNMNSGSKVYIHNAHEVPDSSSHFLNLKYGNQLTVSVLSLTIYSTDDVTSLNIYQRKCRFLEESDLQISPVYSYNLCRMQCRMEQAIRLCGCKPHFYRTKLKFPVCNLGGMRCLGRYKTTLISLREDKHKLCDCLPPCDDVNYVIDYEEHIEWKLGTNVIVKLSKYPRMRLKRSLIFGFTDVLVAIGASTGLFLGCSILSFLEIIYFFTLRLYWFTLSRRFN